MAFKADDYFEISKNLDIFTSVYKEVNTTYVEEVKPGELIRAAIDGMLASLDPYTNFYSEAQAEDYRYQVTGTYAGIGATIRTIDGKVAIESPYDGFPAQKAGLLPGDIILAIDGVSMEGKNTQEVSSYLKGSAGTELTLLVSRLKAGELEIKLRREKIALKNVPYYGMLQNNVGYIQLTGFTLTASKEMREAVMALKKDGATSLVLDLRNNGGGLMLEAVKIVNIFVDRGQTIVTTKGKFSEDNKAFATPYSAVDTEIPLAVLINDRSASASEIVAGALQDLDRAVIIGRNSFGKGLVQTTKQLTYNTQMKITTARYYIPSGRLVQRLDYGNKINGKATAVADSAKKTFYTTTGRPVTDGEGVHPDIKVELDPLSKLSQSLLKNNLIFLYGNVYRSEHDTIAAPVDFTLSDEEYLQFQEFLNDKEYHYTTRTEEALNKMRAEAKEDKYSTLLASQFAALENSLNNAKKEDLSTNKEEIKEMLEYEIVKRYYFDRGKKEVGFDDDKDLLTAQDLLKNPSEIKRILNK